MAAYCATASRNAALEFSTQPGRQYKVSNAIIGRASLSARRRAMVLLPEPGEPITMTRRMGGPHARAARAARRRAKSSPAWWEERVSGEADTIRKPFA